MKKINQSEMINTYGGCLITIPLRANFISFYKWASSIIKSFIK